jgi:hypothetical protein
LDNNSIQIKLKEVAFMINKLYKLIILIGICIVALITVILFVKSKQSVPAFQRIESASEFSSEAKDRDEYFFRLLRDPATNQIPKNIRRRELEFAKSLSEKNKLNKVSNSMSLDWKEAGPNDVGGRTRALAVDITNSNNIIAGGISGGIWKSTDKGQTWKFKSTTSQLLSVTSIAQDPRSGQTNTWYYCTGEYTSNSANDQGYRAYFSGDGLFKSTDNGETWNQLQSTTSPDPTKWDGDFDYCSKVVVNKTGSVFVAVNATGIFRSTDGGNSWTLVLGATNEHIYSDVTVASDGTVLAIISSPYQGGNAQTAPGIYKSINDGVGWTNITPNSFPTDHMRSVLGSAPSNPNILYVLIHAGDLQNGREDIRFFKINIANGSSEDRSNNLPDFSADGGVASKNGFYTSQGDYDMAIAVKPDDENFVLISGTCLFRSTDAFATKLTDKKNGWIGGYNEVTFGYPNFHPDIHSFAFDPSNSNSMWWGNDGGLTFTNDIRNTSYQDYFPWESKNNGYNVTQFYQCALADQPNDNRLVGGAQDNGSPFFTFDGTTISKSTDVSSGDGAYAYLGKNFAYSSSQKGSIIRINYDNNGKPDESLGWTAVYPKNAQNQLFVTPYAVDPADENVMYYPSANTLWRNNQLESIPNYLQDGTDVGWIQLNVNVPQGYLISTLTVSKSPAHVLYYALSSDQDAPKIYRLDNANTQNSQGNEISIPTAPQGAYVHNIAVNPDDANEIIIVMSNYNIVGLYRSTNGGQSYDPIEGNLEGTQQNPGPSLRAASILPTSNGNLYLVATSIGVFSTSQLNGNLTNWAQEGANEIGNVVVNYIVTRKSDGKIVAATHGRGMWVTNLGSTGSNAIATVDVQSLHIESKPGLFGTNRFTLSNTGGANLNYTISANAKSSAALSGNIGFINVLQKPIPSGLKFSNNKTGNLPLTSGDNFNYKLNKISPPKTFGNDVLVLDDGNATSDDFLGFGDGSDFTWINEFDLGSKDFSMDSFDFFMRTENAFTNTVYVAVMDDSFTKLAEGYVSLNLSSQGDWFTITLTPALNFSAGKTFYVLVQSYLNGINYPAGVDKNGLLTGKSFYLDASNNSLVNINTISGFTNGAFLIRAVGTLSGGTGNQPPNAVAQVSKTNAQVGESITFDASSSYDNDGQIVQYSWDFGDQTNSSQKIDNHTYNQANTYTYTLTVKDDKGAIGQTQGQIIVSGTGGNRLTTDPQNGTLAPNSSIQITVKFDASGLPEGNYQGQVMVNSNGGNIDIPVDILVSNNAVDVKQQKEIPNAFSLDQNYPNPFNPTTIIRYSIPEQQHVKIIIYNMNGQEVKDLVNSYQEAGAYEISWNGKNDIGALVASGVYLCVLNSENYSGTKKMVFMK